MKKKVEKVVGEALSMMEGFSEEELAGVVANLVCLHEVGEGKPGSTEVEQRMMLYVLPAVLKKYGKL